MRHTSAVRSLGVVTLSLSLLAAACGASSHPAGRSSSVTSRGITSPGITSSTITIGEIADVSGAIPGLFSNAVDGTQAWVAYVNANGGIDGRRIALQVKDSALSCNVYRADLTSLASSTFAVVGSLAVFDTCGMPVLRSHPTFPDVQALVLSSPLNALPNVFSPTSGPLGFTTTGYQYVKDRFPKAIAHTAALYSASLLSDFQEQSNAARSIGYHFVYDRGGGLTETNFTSDVLRMKNDGVQVVDLTDTSAQVAADFEQEATQQNFHPLAVIAPVAYDANFFTELGPTADADNVIMPLPNALYLGQDASTVPMVKTFLHYFAQTHPGVAPNEYGLGGFAAGLLFEQALKASGSPPTRAGLLRSLAATTSFNADGLGPTGDPGQKLPRSCLLIAGIKGRMFVRLDPPKTGYECRGTFVPLPAG